jgi:hypothetical protein
MQSSIRMKAPMSLDVSSFFPWWRLHVHHLSLSFYDPLYDVLVIFTVDEQVRNELLIPVVAFLGRRHDHTRREMLFVIKDVRHQRRFPCATLSYEYTNLVVSH